jgi:uncharacterized protein YecT (DUF1311 family)
MRGRTPKVHWRRGHAYVNLKVEITQQQRIWLEEIDAECQAGLGAHVRFAISQYRARLNQQRIELAKRLQRTLGVSGVVAKGAQTSER